MERTEQKEKRWIDELDILKTGEMTISEIMDALQNRGYELSNNRVSALVSALRDDGLLVRTVGHGKAYFSRL